MGTKGTDPRSAIRRRVLAADAALVVVTGLAALRSGGLAIGLGLAAVLFTGILGWIFWHDRRLLDAPAKDQRVHLQILVNQLLGAPIVARQVPRARPKWIYSQARGYFCGWATFTNVAMVVHPDWLARKDSFDVFSIGASDVAAVATWHEILQVNTVFEFNLRDGSTLTFEIRQADAMQQRLRAIGVDVRPRDHTSSAA